MRKGKKASASRAMLDLWRPPQGAGDPVGCLATTYTFAPGLFDEQCLARFLEIGSEPNREDLAFLLERESRLGSVYAGVLVDHTQAGVEHSLRWDVLPVRLRAGKQHAKLSLLAWGRHVRIIVASANLTGPGYRTNHEVGTAVDLTRAAADLDLFASAVALLRGLLAFVPGVAEHPPAVRRAEAFLDQLEGQVQDWTPKSRRGGVRQQLVCTLPGRDGRPARSALGEAIEACRGRGRSPGRARIASPFFDDDSDTSRVTASLCKLMARGAQRELCFCVPAVRDTKGAAVPRLAAPKSILLTPRHYRGSVTIEMLPESDTDRNRRRWHAKMLALSADGYSALMVGSSNFTGAGMGVVPDRNAEANLLTIVDRAAYSRSVGQLEAVWPATDRVIDPMSAEWLGTRPDPEEDEQAAVVPLPTGFVSATYRAGDRRVILLRLDPAQLPEAWCLYACGQHRPELLSDSAWREQGCPAGVELPWLPVQPPEKLRVQWGDHEAFMPLNVEDGRALPPPAVLEHMTADDMLLVLAAADPSAAFRAWARRQQPSDSDDYVDSATPIDLDPLRRYELHATFLHRIRRRARVLAQLRANLERPVWGRQALEWRLRGLIGVEALVERLLRELREADGSADEALLTLADLMIVLSEVDYHPSDGSLSAEEFQEVFRPFLSELADTLEQQVCPTSQEGSEDLARFWTRVMARCRG